MQVVLSLSPGGTERLVIDIVRFLHANRIDSVVCCLDEEGAWASEVASLGVPVVALGRKPGFRPGLGRTIARIASRYQVDVMHCHHYSSFVYGQLGTSLWSGPSVLFTEHGRLSDAPPSAKRRLVNPWLGRLPSAIYAVSEDLRQHMIAEGFPPARVTVLNNGIQAGPPVTEAARRAARAALEIPADSFVVGTVGRLDPVKDFATLIQAAGQVHRDVGNMRLVIVGDGPERDELASLTRRLDADGLVQFTGHRHDVRALLPALDLFVNSSIHEGISLTILEAMAAGLPIVATRVGGNPEVVTPDVGLLVAPRSAAALAAAISDLASDSTRRETMGASARRRAETAFSARQMLDAYLRGYRGCASAPATRPSP